MKKPDLMQIYNKLLTAFGPQHWWPAKTVDETVIGAILTQNVAWTNVEKAINQLKSASILTLQDVLNCETKKLSDLILPARYSRQKAVYLQEIAAFFKKYNYYYQTFIEKKALEEIRKQILTVKGVGEETADTILLYALHLPSFVIDVYTKRIFFRLGLLKDEKIKYHEAQQLFHSVLNQNPILFNEYHALIVKLAKEHCQKKKPLCQTCPLASICLKKIC